MAMEVCDPVVSENALQDSTSALDTDVTLVLEWRPVERSHFLERKAVGGDIVEDLNFGDVGSIPGDVFQSVLIIVSGSTSDIDIGSSKSFAFHNDGLDPMLTVYS